MTFNEALEAMKVGKKVRREKWRNDPHVKYIHIHRLLVRWDTEDEFAMIPDDIFADDWEVVNEKPEPPALKPCPHCGSNRLYAGTKKDGLYFVVHCLDCNAKMDGIIERRDDVIAAWNRRAEAKPRTNFLRWATLENVAGIIDADCGWKCDVCPANDYCKSSDSPSCFDAFVEWANKVEDEK